MAYSFTDSKRAYETVRQLLLNATDKRLDVSVVMGDADFSAIIADPNEQIEFLWSREGKDYNFSEVARTTANVNFSGPANGDGDITVRIGGELFTFTPAAGDADLEMANACISAINGASSEYTAGLKGTSTVEIIPLVGRYVESMSITIEDTGAAGSFNNPVDYYLGGTMDLKQENLTFMGTSSKV